MERVPPTKILIEPLIPGCPPQVDYIKHALHIYINMELRGCPTQVEQMHNENILLPHRFIIKYNFFL